MRLATVRLPESAGGAGGTPVAAVVEEDRVFPLPGGIGVGALVEAGLERALDAGRSARRGGGVDLAEVRLELPYRPPSIRDFVTFESHVEGVRRSVDGASGVPEAWYDAPTFYFTNPHALYGPGAPITRPATCRALDFELEVACVLGRGGTDLTEAQAKDAIFGYAILNDWSARDLQSREMKVGLGPAKGKDFATSIGPWIVTADEVEERHTPEGFLDLDCRVSVNGTQVGHDRLAHMHWTFAQMVAYASRDSVVVPGDLLASGTTGGGGCLAELWGRRGIPDPPPLEPGDEVRIDVEHLGTLAAAVAPD
jgi:2-keto-4-pentenoate hydratase/2-oxohepta-3-ene-1,7-dioic acid hydratase in catechol pathway